MEEAEVTSKAGACTNVKVSIDATVPPARRDGVAGRSDPLRAALSLDVKPDGSVRVETLEDVRCCGPLIISVTEESALA